ncbi:9540_t:CDS:2 [Dentiscutata heterogama]|uniref:9540_t:CDS:1 n=1 Tax=Dentiscutata heterogama TaxID=1316150 RepID=A0ACA9LZH2_9GLOM|nr:9540_t:CDS:2 [Dentiscutata heterogama]
MPLNLSATLLDDISRLYIDADDYNVIITAGQGDDARVFKAHTVILRSRSSYFRVALSSNWAKKIPSQYNHEFNTQCDALYFNKPNISPKVFDIILKYIYTGTCSLEENDILLDILIASDEFGLFELVNYVQEHIISDETGWLHENLVKVFKVALRHDEFHLLREHCGELISKQPELLFNSKDFVTLEKSCMIFVLKRDDIAMGEIDIWDHMIRWGIEQHPQLNPDISNWTRQHYDTLHIRLKELLPLIRYFDVPEDKFYDKIWPFKKFLPRNLKQSLTRFYIVPGIKPPSCALSPRIAQYSPKSKLGFTGLHAALIANWINHEDNEIPTTSSNISHEFKLLLRGSRDGRGVITFHELCDFKGATIVLIKVMGTGELIGGYNPNSWTSSDRYIRTTESFIFSLGNNAQDPSNYILSRVRFADFAIRDSSTVNTSIGFGNDFWWFEGKCVHFNYNKKILDTRQFFSIEDYEVFQVVKKE